MATRSRAEIELDGAAPGRLPLRHLPVHHLAAAAIVPSHAWAILVFLWQVPGLRLHMDPLEIGAVLAYTLLFALGDSLLPLGTVLILGAALPLVRNALAHKGALAILYIGLWTLPLQFLEPLTRRLQPDWLTFLGALGLWLAILPLGWVLVSRTIPHRPIAAAFLERLTVLAGVYLALDALSLGWILFRNLR